MSAIDAPYDEVEHGLERHNLRLLARFNKALHRLQPDCGAGDFAAKICRDQPRRRPLHIFLGVQARGRKR